MLSCLGVPARDEWLALSGAFAAAAALQVEVLVIVSEEALFDEIQPAAPANVRVEFVPPDLTNLQQMVRAFRPHVLHFFCHGSAQTSPHLRIAVKSDWLLGGQSSITVEPREIRAFTEPTDDRPWLVVLNCCESAAADGAEDVQSIALRLVVDGAVPAVVGMREPVRSNDANLFTRAFYGRLLGELKTRTTAATSDTEPIDWAQLVVQARTELARKHPGLIFSQAAASTKEWTMPVVYMRPTPFTMRLAPAGPPPGPPGAAPTPRALRLQIEALRGMLAQVPPDDPSQALRDDIEQQLAALTRLPGSV